ncbi:hypothetical protein M0805_000289, partial [Coniferiporia weirii]
RVRFRSRVRIGSGLRHSQPAYSGDSSASSSISAPLRYNREESDAEQVAPQVLSPDPYRRPSASRLKTVKWLKGTAAPARTSLSQNNASERTPLLRAPASRLGERTRRRYGLADDEETRAARRRARAERKNVEEAVFGEWPWRLFNGYWWVWKCEPVVCCCCLTDDSDSDIE